MSPACITTSDARLVSFSQTKRWFNKVSYILFWLSSWFCWEIVATLLQIESGKLLTSSYSVTKRFYPKCAKMCRNYLYRSVYGRCLVGARRQGLDNEIMCVCMSSSCPMRSSPCPNMSVISFGAPHVMVEFFYMVVTIQTKYLETNYGFQIIFN